MSERITSNETPTRPERPVITVESELERPDGSRAEFNIELLPDGKPKALAFFDVDKTLVRLDPVYRESIHELFPQDPDLDHQLEVYRSAFYFGSSWAEMTRMRGIYEEGKKQWEVPRVFERERFKSPEQLIEINNAGSETHTIADKLLHRFDEIASRVIAEQYQHDPESFEAAKIQPIYHLAEVYKRLGVPMVCMSANPGKFIRSACKYMGLSDYFIDVASDWDVEGDKEHKIKYLVERLESKGVPVPYSRMIVVGDSIRGDVGAGWRYGQKLHKNQKEQPVSVKGILVVEDSAALANAEERVANDPELKDMVASTDVQAFDLSQVTYSPEGTPNIGGKHRAKFMSRLRNVSEGQK